MAANALRLRRSLALTSSILNHSKHFSSVAPTSSPSTIQQNPSTFDVKQSKPSNLSSQFISSRSLSTRPRYNNDDDDNQISPDAILFEGCDYNHWLITMDFPKDPKPSPEEMVETYVQTAAKVLGSVEEAKKKIYACSTTTYNGFQVEVSEEVSEQFKGIPGVVFVLPDSYIDPVNKEYGGDKYINGTIIPRPPPVQYGRQGGRFNDRNRDYNRPPPRGRMEQGGGPPGGQGNNYQGDRRGPMPSYQANYNQGDGRNFSPPRQPDYPQRDQGNFAPPPPPPVGGYTQGGGGGGSYRQGTEGQYGQGGGAGGGYGGQYGQPGGGNYRQGGGGGGNYGQVGGGGNYGGGQYGQGGGGGGQFGEGVGGGQFGQGGGGGGGGYGQGGGRQYGQGGGGNYGQGYGQGSSQYGESSGYSQADQRRDISGQQGNYEEVDAFKGR